MRIILYRHGRTTPSYQQLFGEEQQKRLRRCCNERGRAIGGMGRGGDWRILMTGESSKFTGMVEDGGCRRKVWTTIFTQRSSISTHFQVFNPTHKTYAHAYSPPLLAQPLTFDSFFRPSEQRRSVSPVNTVPVTVPPSGRRESKQSLRLLNMVIDNDL